MVRPTYYSLIITYYVLLITYYLLLVHMTMHVPIKLIHTCGHRLVQGKHE